MVAQNVEEPTLIHADEEIVAANEAVCSLIGADSCADLVGRSLLEFVDSTDHEPLRAQFEQVSEGQAPALGLRVEMTTLEGHTRDVIALSSPVEWEHERHLQTTYLTISEGDTLSAVLLREYAMQEAPIGVTIADVTREDDPLIYVNDGFVELTGYPRAEILGRNCRFLQGENTREEPVTRMREAIEAGEYATAELRNYRKDGSMFWNHVTLSPVRDDAGELTHYLGFQQDVSDKKGREREKTLFEKQAEAADHAILITDREGTIEYVNPAFERMTGYTADEAIGETPRILKSGAHDEAFYEELWETITAGDVWERTITNETKMGERYRAEQTIVPITDDRGEITHFAAIEVDVTDERLTSQMMDVMHRALRHNVRTSVQVIDSYAELIQAESDSTDHRAGLQTIRDHAESLRELSDQLTTIQQVLSTHQTTRQSVESVVEGCIRRCRTTYSDADITLEMAIDESQMMENGSVLQLALTEAIENAVVHTDQHSPAVEIAVRPLGNHERVAIEIADTGPGIPEAEWEIIASGEETPLLHSSGIGLWLMYWAITILGGTISYSQNAPSGSVVTFEVPTTDNGR